MSHHSLSVYTELTSEQIAKDFHSSRIAGLSRHGRQRSKKMYGGNPFPWGFLYHLVQDMISPFVPGMAIVAVYLALFNHPFLLPFLGLLGIHILLQGLSHWQFIRQRWRQFMMLWKTHRAKVLCIRGRSAVKVRASQLVHGDVILLSEGIHLPVDCKIIEADHLHMDEALLFGAPYQARVKSPRDSKVEDLRDSRSLAFAGSTVLSGVGKAMVINAGKQRLFLDGFLSKEHHVQLEKQLWQLGKMHLLFSLILLILIQTPTLAPYNLFFLGFYAFTTPLLLPLLTATVLLPGKAGALYENSKSLLLPITNVVKHDILESTIFVNRTNIEMYDRTSVSTNAALLKQFLEVFHLGLPRKECVGFFKEWNRLKNHLSKEHAITLTPPASLKAIPGRSVYEVDATGEGLMSMFVYEHNMEDGRNMTIKTKIRNPRELIEEATYIWDDQLSGSRRRFFVQEKKKLFEQLDHLDEQGFHILGVAFEEEELTEKGPLVRDVFIGYIAIPALVPHEYFTLLEQARGAHKTIILYSLGEVNKKALLNIFSKDQLEFWKDAWMDKGLIINEGKKSKLMVLEHATYHTLRELTRRDESFPHFQNNTIVGNEEDQRLLPKVHLSSSKGAKHISHILGHSAHLIFKVRSTLKLFLGSQFAAGLLGGWLYFTEGSLSLMTFSPLLLSVMGLMVIGSYVVHHMRSPGFNQFSHPKNTDNYTSIRYFYDLSFLITLATALGTSFAIFFLFITLFALQLQESFAGLFTTYPTLVGGIAVVSLLSSMVALSRTSENLLTISVSFITNMILSMGIMALLSSQLPAERPFILVFTLLIVSLASLASIAMPKVVSHMKGKAASPVSSQS